MDLKRKRPHALRGVRTGLALLMTHGLVSAATLVGQVRPADEPELPREVVQELLGFLNDPQTVRFSGELTLPSAAGLTADVGVLGGPLHLAGTVDGSVAVVNGRLILAPGARVTGGVLVVGGEIEGDTAGSVGGEVRVFPAPLRYSLRDDRIVEIRTPGQPRAGFGPSGPRGSVRLLVQAGTNYNRVEGLPVLVGPVARTGGSRPFALEAFAIWRTDTGFDLARERFGYRIRGQHLFNPSGGFSVGGGLFSELEPLERWGVSDLEASLSTFLLHRDFRDYVERRGWEAFLRVAPPGSSLSGRLGYTEEQPRFAPSGGPWSLMNNDEPWRPQPAVAEGRLRSLQAVAEYDSRNDPERPVDGWWAEARIRWGLGGHLTIPELLDLPADELPLSAHPDVPRIASREVSPDLRSGFLDLRRYNRLTPGTSLVLRMVTGGPLGSGPLPPQYQHALGGEGSLPAFRLFQGDCGARQRQASLPFDPQDLRLSRPAYAAYGCDGFLLFQGELRSELPWTLRWPGRDRDWDDWTGDWDWRPFLEWTPALSLFVNTGHGWVARQEEPGPFIREDTGRLTDVGAGLFLGPAGLYLAAPLQGDGRGLSFFVRLIHRF